MLARSRNVCYLSPSLRINFVARSLVITLQSFNSIDFHLTLFWNNKKQPATRQKLSTKASVQYLTNCIIDMKKLRDPRSLRRLQISVHCCCFPSLPSISFDSIPSSFAKRKVFLLLLLLLPFSETKQMKKELSACECQSVKWNCRNV